jgi:hypothetical protein
MPWPGIEHIILDLHSRLGEICGMLQAHTKRLDRIEDRLNKDKIRFPDIMPYLLGLLVLGLTALGRNDLAQAVATVLGR